MKYNKFLQHTLFIKWATLFVVVVLVFILVRTAFTQIFVPDIELTQFLVRNSVEVGSETVDGYQQVYYIWNDTKSFITQGSQNSTQAVSDGTYIAFSTAVDGAGQIFLYHIPSNQTVQITSTGTNLQPRLSNGKVVWEGWIEIEDEWQVFFYDGQTVQQLTRGDLSINPDIAGDQVIYASKDSQDEWRTFSYSLGTKRAEVIKSGPAARYPKFINGEVVFELEELLARQEAQQEAIREALRIAGEEARLKAEALLLQIPPTEPVDFATLYVIKLVVNGVLGTAVAGDFNVHVMDDGEEVSGSPAVGAAVPGTSYSLSAGTYTVSEDASTSLMATYMQSFIGDCDENGVVMLEVGEDKICTIVNTDIPLPEAVELPEIIDSAVTPPSVVAPLISILKVPSSLVFLENSGEVTYDYTVSNVLGLQALTDVGVTDDKCSPVNFISGDDNSNDKLDIDESWIYNCISTLGETTTNTAVATGYSDDVNHLSAIDTAITTVVVGGVFPDEEPPAEEPPAEEPPAEEPPVEEPLINEPPAEEPPAEEIPDAELPVEESPTEEPPAEEPPAEESESSIEEPLVEEPSVEEPLVEESPAEEIPNEESPTPGLPDTGRISSPLINILTVPSRLTPFPFGGGKVTYTYQVTNPGVMPMHDVSVVDDKCAQVSFISGDINNNDLLDSSEAWIYNCQMRVWGSTRNIAMAEGKANDYTALGYAFSTVLVTAFSLKNQGLAILFGVLILVNVVLLIFYGKKIFKSHMRK